MDRNEYDLILGKLAVHFKVLPKDKVSEALQRRRLVDETLDLGQFLVDEGYVAPDVYQKLEKARVQYLQKNGLEPPAAEPAMPIAPAVPVAPELMVPSAPVAPVAPVAPDDDPESTQPALILDPDPPAPEPAAPALAIDPIEPAPPIAPAAPELTLDPIAPAAPQPATPQPAAPQPATPMLELDPLSSEPAPSIEPMPVQPAEPMLELDPLAELAPPAEPVAPAEPQPVSPEPAPPRTAVPEPAAAQPAAAQPAAAQPAGPVAMPVSSGEHLLQIGADVTLESILTQARQHDASDLHLHCKAPIRLRLTGRMVDAGPMLSPEQTRALILQILTDEQRAWLDENLQLDFSYEIPGVGRFRANAYKQQNGFDAVFRAIPPEPPTLAELGLPDDLERVVSFHQGIVLFTGPAGCGKSSTMAAIVRLLNGTRPDHIITVEDPIEYVHRSDQCLVNQRQVGPHTESFARALRAALREDPDIIAIGELRDLETIELALTAAETGHLVVATLHTSSAIRTINRLLGVFPPEQQNQIRTMVSESLRAVVSQRLVPRADGQGRAPAIEVLMNTRAIGNLIREKKTFQIASQMQTGSQLGMRLLDNSLLDMVKSGLITKEEARRNAEDPKRFA